MGVPISQMYTVASYVLGQRLRGRKQYPLVVMLEPLFRCNLACAGCGKIQHPTEVLRRNLTPEECFGAVEEAGAPMVSIPGGEPLLHPQIVEIVEGLIARKKYVYMCTNAVKLEESLPQFKPNKRLSFSVHLDGAQAVHDHAVCREGVYEIAVRAIRAAVKAGFRVTTNTTLYHGTDVAAMRSFFDEAMRLGVEGMMVSPGYAYEKAPDQDSFLHREQTRELFKQLLAKPGRGWKFNQTPLFLQYLQGNWQLECTPWGSPAYNLFGWQKPCYLLDEGHTETFAELMATTKWENYGRASGNPKCADCMVHCGYEPSAVNHTFGSMRGFLATAMLSLFGRMGPLGMPNEKEVQPQPATDSKTPIPAPHMAAKKPLRTDVMSDSFVDLEVIEK